MSSSRAPERTELDIAAAARLFPAEPGRLAPTLAGQELAVDKVLALFGRAEARDFIDLMAVEPRYGLDRLSRLAAQKDRGFTPAMLAEMLPRSAGCDGRSSTSTTPATLSLLVRSSAGASRRLS